MDPFGTTMSCLDLIERIKEHIDQAKANKSQCNRLGERILAIRDTIQVIAPQETQMTQNVAASYGRALGRLQITLGDADVLVMSFSRKKWYGRVLQVGNYQSRFEEIYIRLSEDLQLLNVGLNVDHLANASKFIEAQHNAADVMSDSSKDRQAAQADLDTLRGMMGEVMGHLKADILESTNPKLDNIGNIVNMKMDSVEYQMKAMLQMMQDMQNRQLTEFEKLASNTGIAVARAKEKHGIDPLLLTPFYTVEFEKELTRGTFGAIYLGRWHRTTVVIKQPLDLKPEDISEFIREAKLHGRLRHPNIVQFYASCIEPGRCVMLMELMEGGSLLEWVEKNGRIPLEQFKKIAIGITRALHYMHSAGFCHRDLNSKNVLLSADGMTAKLTDFGKAKDGNEGSDVGTSNKNGPTPETLRWQTPEIFYKDGERSSNHRNDMYAFGLILLHMATGKRPYDGLQLTEIAHLLQNGHTEPFPSGFPSLLVDVYQRCTRTRPIDRPSAGAVLDALLKWNPSQTEASSSSKELTWSDSPLSSRREALVSAEREIALLRVQLEKKKIFNADSI